MTNYKSRRSFVKHTALASGVLTLGVSAKSYGRIMGSNDRVNLAVIGINSRGAALVDSINQVPNTVVTDLCDVDSRVTERENARLMNSTGSKARAHVDSRDILARADVDGIVIATPDHWHAIMALMGLKADKHVYVEKPCCHNPQEGEILVAAQQKYGKVVQMGNQQRSGPASIQAVQEMRDGIIGNVYFGKAWYSNDRKSIGRGKKMAAPEWLNWELWQGPAPRREFQDNLVHYDWHWFWHWGTGELNNNGTHEIDVCRWALGVEYPTRVISSGGRYHFDDDWEFADTQIASFEFEGGKMITWEGRSCNNHQFYNRGRGATIHGTEGTVMIDRQGYNVYDQKGKVIKEVSEEMKSSTMDVRGGDGLTTLHMLNFYNAITRGEALTAPIEDGFKSNLLPHLGNIAQHCGRVLDTDPQNGHIKADAAAARMWAREYEPGWEPVI